MEHQYEELKKEMDHTLAKLPAPDFEKIKALAGERKKRDSRLGAIRLFAAAAVLAVLIPLGVILGESYRRSRNIAEEVAYFVDEIMEAPIIGGIELTPPDEESSWFDPEDTLLQGF